VLLQELTEKHTAIPVAQVMAIGMGSLDRLGYAPAAQQNANVQVNVGASPPVQPVDVKLLSEARENMRKLEQSRADAEPAKPTITLESSE
jgi:hypothetical protein